MKSKISLKSRKFKISFKLIEKICFEKFEIFSKFFRQIFTMILQIFYNDLTKNKNEKILGLTFPKHVIQNRSNIKKKLSFLDNAP